VRGRETKTTMTEKKQRILAGAVAGSYSDGLLTGAPHKSQTARRRNRTEMHTLWLCCRRWLCAHCLCKCTASERQVSAHFSLKTYVCLPRVAAVYGRAATYAGSMMISRRVLKCVRGDAEGLSFCTTMKHGSRAICRLLVTDIRNSFTRTRGAGP
jgi:hypothetical protein